MLSTLQSWCFSKRFWLAANVSWSDLELRGDGVYIAQPIDLWWTFPAAAFLFIIRIIFEKLVAAPVGRYYGVLETKPVVKVNHSLEQIYKKNPYPSEAEIQAVVKQTDLSERKIQRWLRRRRNQDRPTGMTKFTETAWRCLFYLAIYIYGLFTVTQETWFWDVKDCWRGHPRHHVKPAIFWYYIIELGFYLSLLFSQFGDVKRKDFWEQFIHHIATIALLSFSWCANYVRIGALILCLHDAADYLLEAAKLARYMEKRTLCDVLFGIFTLTWAATRLTLFPYVILWTTGVDSFEISGGSPVLYLTNGLLWVLQVLHVFWFVFIMTAAVKALRTGKVDRDERSDSEESCGEITPEVGQGDFIPNGKTATHKSTTH